MTTALVTVLVTFILTGVIANRLVQAWQHRNWIRQQRFLGEEKHYLNLAALFEEISLLSGKRLTRMRRLLSAVRSLDANTVDERTRAYDETVLEWNEKFNSFVVRLTISATYEMAQRLDDEVNAAFVRYGRNLEKMVRQRKQGLKPNIGEINYLGARLNSLQGLLFEFNRDVARFANNQRAKTYHGIWVQFTKDTLHIFPTWKLLKFLFVSRIDDLGIIRTTADLQYPLPTGGQGFRVYEE